MTEPVKMSYRVEWHSHPMVEVEPFYHYADSEDLARMVLACLAHYDMYLATLDTSPSFGFGYGVIQKRQGDDWMDIRHGQETA